MAIEKYWNIPKENVLHELQCTESGLQETEASQRLKTYGYNRISKQKKTTALLLFINQFKNPVIIILIVASLLSFFLGDKIDTYLIFSIVLISNLLSYFQEKGASDAVAKLLEMVQVKTSLLRNDNIEELQHDLIVPGDIVLLNAGDIIPADCLLLESNVLFINEASLTGETFPVEKITGILPEETPLAQRKNSLFMGTNVVSGTGKAIVVKTGTHTEFGKISGTLIQNPPETSFQKGITQLGYLLMQITIVIVLIVFASNVFLKRPVLDSFLFAVALAVGLTPQLLPAIISINLSKGAKKMAGLQVIVKRLASIQNLGSMNILCSDKTGTITEGIVKVKTYVDFEGQENEKIFRLAYLNAAFESGFSNPIDKAILDSKKISTENYVKLGEVPYDFIRKKLSIALETPEGSLLITKGALKPIIDICEYAENNEGKKILMAEAESQILEQYEKFSQQGLRTIGVAYKPVEKNNIKKEDESQMVFMGFLVLEDPLKEGIKDTIAHLKKVGISLKIITGDNALVAKSVCMEIGMVEPKILTGKMLNLMSEGALIIQAATTDVFAELEPNQKQYIIRALKKSKNVVGYMGDGINDVSALHEADVGISVDDAVDIAKETADIVLLNKSLEVLIQGVKAGRRTFANTMKYIFMATSANFGNMFSMAGASLLLPFMPMLPTQILLTNLLTDLPEMNIATDFVDIEQTTTPQHWDIGFIRRFMMVFGLISSVFDYLTFGILLKVLNAGMEEFRTGWFVESVISATVIVLVVRTRRSIFKSKPGLWLSIAIGIVVILVAVLPFTGLSHLFGFVPLPFYFYLVLIGITIAYMVSAEIAKYFFYKKMSMRKT